MNKNVIELVGKGHPDRFADYIGEKLLTEYLKQDTKSKVAIEVLVTRDVILLGGEVTSKASLDLENLVKEATKEVYGDFLGKELKFGNFIREQSPELNKLQKKEVVAGDQGVVYGVYSKERFNLIEKLYNFMFGVLATNKSIWPDWKLLYQDGELSFSVCGLKTTELSKLKRKLERYLEGESWVKSIKVNPGGTWMIGGPLADTGVLGRKLMIDTFGSGYPHGGGAWSGKDVSKIDKTGVILATILAYQIHKHHLDSLNKDIGEVIVELTYKIGDNKPKYKIWNNDKIMNFDLDPLIPTLNEFIKKYNLNEIDYGKLVLKGSSAINLFNLIKNEI